MSNYFIPGTKIPATILQPAEGSSYVSLFLDSGEGVDDLYEASVNAGTSNTGELFAVGLGGINGAFAGALNKAGQDANAYQAIHDNLYNTAAPGEHVDARFSESEPVQLSLVQVPDALLKLPGQDGVVFIDVFNAAQLPHENAFNYAMLYLVPPNYTNYETTADFLAAVTATNITLVQLLEVYNMQFAGTGGLQPIGAIRMCLFSGGIYKGEATVDEVAQANVQGLSKGMQQYPQHGLQLVQFEFAEAAAYLNDK